MSYGYYEERLLKGLVHITKRTGNNEKEGREAFAVQWDITGS